MLSEAEGRRVLKALFEARGFAITEDVSFAEDGVEFSADGWDAEQRVGYEYLTREDRDHEDFTAVELARIGEWIEAGTLYFFVVDEGQISDEGELTAAATAFLDEVERRRGAGS
jgi:hypothetical protein